MAARFSTLTRSSSSSFLLFFPQFWSRDQKIHSFLSIANLLFDRHTLYTFSMANEHANPADKLNHMRKKALEGGGVERAEKQHKAGKKTARERIEFLLDPGTFTET